MHREKIQPDPSTCWYAFSAYVELGFHNTAMEALQVLCMRMISEDDSILQDHKAAYEGLVYSEEADVESKIIDIFKGCQEFIATALLSLRWCAINGLLLSWCPDESPWAKRVSSSYAARGEAIWKFFSEVVCHILALSDNSRPAPFRWGKDKYVFDDDDDNNEDNDGLNTFILKIRSAAESAATVLETYVQRCDL